MKPLIAILASALLASIIAGCAASGASVVSGSMPCWGPGSPAREEPPPNPD